MPEALQTGRAKRFAMEIQFSEEKIVQNALPIRAGRPRFHRIFSITILYLFSEYKEWIG